MTDEQSTPLPSNAKAADLPYPGWLPFVLPLAVFTLASNVEAWLVDAWGPTGYPLAYTLKVAATAATLWVAWPVLKSLQGRVSPWAILVGLVGVALWIALSELQAWIIAQGYLPEAIAKYLGSDWRVGFNPFKQLEGNGAAIVWFLVIRFAGFVLLTPVVEELFLRGFFLRFMADGDWWKVPIGKSGPVVFASAAVYGIATHPGEALAAAAWFSLITLLASKTRSFYDCVVAHAVTNLALAIYILTAARWELW